MANLEDGVSSPLLPDLPRYHPPPPTREIPEEEYVTLESFDISQVHAAALAENSERLKADSKKAFESLKETGFLVIDGHGLSKDQIERQYDIAALLFSADGEEKKTYAPSSVKETGKWSGYKPVGHFESRMNGAKDMLEHFDFYPDDLSASLLPARIRPYLKDLRDIVSHAHYTLLPKILVIISLGLGLPSDALWKLHHRGGGFQSDRALVDESTGDVSWVHSRDHYRLVKYHHGSGQGDGDETSIWLREHTDIGSVTFHYPQPISALQLRTPDGQWRWVRYYPESILVNLGDSMEIITGGLLKAPVHRGALSIWTMVGNRFPDNEEVNHPPSDQRRPGSGRIGAFYFVPVLSETPLAVMDPMKSAGALDRLAEYSALSQKPLTADEWHKARARFYGTEPVEEPERTPEGVLRDFYFRIRDVV